MCAADVQITYAEDLQSELIVVKTNAVTDEQIRCLATVERASPYPVVLFEDETVGARSSVLQRQEERAVAREWLNQRGRLADLPSYDPNRESLSTYAQRLEAFCGIEPGTILTVHDLGVLTFKQEWIEAGLHQPVLTGDDEKFQCLLKAVSASNLEEHGVGFGFVGTEAAELDNRNL